MHVANAVAKYEQTFFAFRRTDKICKFTERMLRGAFVLNLCTAAAANELMLGNLSP